MSNTPNLQLGNLDFNSIKNSIIDHLRTQDQLKDYDYESSAAQVLLDILAYNTLYYAFYSNMIASEMFLDTAQREESIISLVKPLGYVVPGKTSAQARVKVRGWESNSTIPSYTKFRGNNSVGTEYSFYTVQDYGTDDDGESQITIVEGRSLSKQIPVLVDPKTQKAFLSGLDIDISTLTVEVYDPNPVGGIEDGPDIGWQVWGRAGNIESDLNDKSKVYWMERSELGFFIVFGGNLTSTIGQGISPNDKVRVTYLKSNGERANSVGDFSTSGAAVDTTSLSSGGTDKPDIEAIRFFAPKWFASQDRAVTVEDCRALLAKEGFVSGGQDPYSQFNVWGGEEMSPPRYGRVFVTLSTTAEQEPQKATVARQLLERKTCVSIIPEFVDMEEFILKVSGNAFFEPLDTQLSSEDLRGLLLREMNNIYQPRFNQKYSLSTFVQQTNSLDSAMRASEADLSFVVRTEMKVNSDSTVQNKYFGNRIRPGSITSDEFEVVDELETDAPDRLVRLRNRGDVDGRSGKQKIEAYYTAGGLVGIVGDVGWMIPETGEVHIDSGLVNDSFFIEVEPSVDSGSPSFRATEQKFSRTDFQDVQIRRVGID